MPHKVAGIGLLQGEGRHTSRGYRRRRVFWRATCEELAWEALGQVLHAQGDVWGCAAMRRTEWGDVLIEERIRRRCGNGARQL
jgi:hypothetical protein